MTVRKQQNNYDLRHRDPENWRFGVFYVNKKDSRIFVPKINPMLGMTINFGNPLTYLLILVIALVIAMLIVLF